MKVMIVAGDPSGDVYGGALAQALRTRRPGIRLFGMGGPHMRKAGVRILFPLTGLSSVGVVEGLRNVPILKRLLGRMGDVLENQRPDVVVLIDFPGFNMKLGELAKEKDVPVVFYFSPSAWAWGKGRAQKVAATATRVCAVLPQEDEVYRDAGASVTFVGHPLLDLIRVSDSPASFRREVDLTDAKPLIALLPGSRRQELRTLLPAMVRAIPLIQEELPQARFAAAVAPDFRAEELEAIATAAGAKPGGPGWPRWVENRQHDVLAAADLAVIASGTATLEAALLGTPMVAVYKVAPSTYALAKMLVKTEFVALPNIIAGQAVVPELLQHDATPTRIAQQVIALWQDEEARETMRSQYDEIRRRLGGPGAVERAADAVLEVGDGR